MIDKEFYHWLNDIAGCMEASIDENETINDMKGVRIEDVESCQVD